MMAPTDMEGILKQNIKSINIGGKEYPVDWEGSIMVVKLPSQDICEMIKNSLPENFRALTNVEYKPDGILIKVKVL